MTAAAWFVLWLVPCAFASVLLFVLFDLRSQRSHDRRRRERERQELHDVKERR